MPYRLNTDPPLYPHLGQPEGQTTRAASEWKRANTYHLRAREELHPAVVAEPMDCFTPKEWEGWLAMVVASGGYYMPNSPNVSRNITDESPADRLARQRRAVRAAACDDCTLAQQLSERMAGRCHPIPYAITPVKRLLESEGVPDGAAPGRGTEPAHVLQQGAYPTEKFAKQVARGVLAKRGTALRVYQCPTCLLFHLTQQVGS